MGMESLQIKNQKKTQQNDFDAKIVVIVEEQQFYGVVNVQGKKSEWLLDQIYELIKGQDWQDFVIGFQTCQNYYMIDYLLTQKNIDVQFLAGNMIHFKPIFHEQQTMPQIGLRDFKLLKQIGSGGFSRVYLGII